MALLDRDGLYGAPRFHMAAQKAGIRAHIGAEVTCVNGHRVPLLCETREGYQNLWQLLTRIRLRVPKNDPKLKPAATLDELREFRAGLICLDPSFVSIYGAANTHAELQRQVRIVVAHLHPPAFEFACQFYEGYAKLALFRFSVTWRVRAVDW